MLESEKLLHGTQIRPTFQHCSGRGVAEAVRRKRGTTGLRGDALDQTAYLALADTATP